MTTDSLPARRSPARAVAFLAVSLSFAVALIGWAGSSPSVAGPLSVEDSLSPAERAAVAQVRQAFRASLDEREAAFAAADSLSPREIGMLRRSRNAAHVRAARQLGVAPVATDSALAFAGGLNRLDDASPYYATWGTGPLSPDALAALDQIGERFQARLAEAGLPPARFVVSSAFRTAEHQDRLRGVNANAARGRSSHEYGTTFDLAYRRYRIGHGVVERPEMPAELSTLARLWLDAELDDSERAWADRVAVDYAGRYQAELGRALIDLEDQGVLLALREVRQPCFHVTVARRLV